MKGFRDGAGVLLGFEEEGEDERPWKEANAEGVKAVASAGGGRPVIFAMRVRAQRRRVKMPRMEPSVLRKLENCSATETIAVMMMLVWLQISQNVMSVIKSKKAVKNSTA